MSQFCYYKELVIGELYKIYFCDRVKYVHVFSSLEQLNGVGSAPYELLANEAVIVPLKKEKRFYHSSKDNILKFMHNNKIYFIEIRINDKFKKISF